MGKEMGNRVGIRCPSYGMTIKWIKNTHPREWMHKFDNGCKLKTFRLTRKGTAV